MKQILLTIVVLLLAGTMVYAQQAGGPPQSAETRQSAQQTVTQSRTNSSQFVAALADLNARNTSNIDAAYYNQLKADIDKLEAAITSEEGKIRASLDRGSKVGPQLFERIQRLIDQHKAKTDELDAFTSTR